MEERECKILRLQDRAGGVGRGIRTSLRKGRFEVPTAGLDQNLQLTGGDPWGTSTFTGLVVPAAPTLTPSTRYLFMLARYSFNAPESAWVRGLRLYTSLFGTNAAGQGPFELEIKSPMWRFSIGGGNVTFHVMVVDRGFLDKRHPSNADSFVFRDSVSPALLFENPRPYTPPNGGIPWGNPLGGLGTIHDMRFKWRESHAEESLCIPIPAPCDVAIYASVWQHNPVAPGGGANQPTFTANELSAVSPEDRFWATMSNVQYGRIAASLIIGEEMAKDDSEDGEGA